MPCEVFDLWIRPYIKDYGWPFSVSKMSVADTKWQRFFLGRSLDYWAAIHWHLAKVAFREKLFNTDSTNRIRWIIDNVVFGKDTPTTNVEDTSKRFWTCAAFIQNHGNLPHPIVAVATPFGLSVVDGNHRLAALVHLRKAEGLKIPILLGLESPL
jgi:hypothetical protein